MGDSDNEVLDAESRICEWKDCYHQTQGLEPLVSHVNSVHVQVFYLNFNNILCKELFLWL